HAFGRGDVGGPDPGDELFTERREALLQHAGTVARLLPAGLVRGPEGAFRLRKQERAGLHHETLFGFAVRLDRPERKLHAAERLGRASTRGNRADDLGEGVELELGARGGGGHFGSLLRT